MKEECQIVRDLLLGYKDNTLFEASKKLVKNHLENCDSCKEVFKEIKEENEKNVDVEAVEGLKKVNQKMKKKNLIINIVIVLIILFMIFSMFAFINYKNSHNVEIFLSDEITEEDIKEIENKILQLDENAQITYKSKEETLAEMKKSLGQQEYLLDGYEDDNIIFPASFIVKVKRNKVDILKNIMISKKCVINVASINLDPYSLLITQTLAKIKEMFR